MDSFFLALGEVEARGSTQLDGNLCLSVSPLQVDMVPLLKNS